MKRTLSTTPDKFNNDVLASNTKLAELLINLLIDEFIVDLYALGIEEAGVLTYENEKLTV